MRQIHVKQWRLEKHAMPRLRHLVIDKCYRLSELPEELWSLTALRLVHVLWPPKELANSLKDLEPRNGCKLIVSNASQPLELSGSVQYLHFHFLCPNKFPIWNSRKFKLRMDVASLPCMELCLMITDLYYLKYFFLFVNNILN